MDPSTTDSSTTDPSNDTSNENSASQPPRVFKKVDLHCKTNNSTHHTSDIREDQLIVRRGQPFLMTLDLLRPFNPESDTLTITAITGSHPSEERGTRSVFGIPKSPKTSPAAIAVWKVELHKSSQPQTGRVTLAVTPPPDAPTGQYSLSVRTSQKKDAMEEAPPDAKKEPCLGTLVLLFNPWCSDDWVYLADEDERQEYVMNEQGMIYKGSIFVMLPVRWDYGQFEEEVVEICLKMLDVNLKHKKDPANDVSARCSPIYVSRVVSAMMNSDDDSGVLVGSWEGDYGDGLPPSHWNGSVDILRRWHDRDCQPVKYGQCWVFAGVMCTVLRCLGIPCRVVTNYSSAYDDDYSLTIDICYAENGRKRMESEDSLWNYHVWVEAWMRRPDLSEDGSYDGWQVVDPTPQQLSGGVYCCGPASVKAIYRGDVHLKYDVPFVFAEVNADRVEWLIKEDSSRVRISSDTTIVGKNISTKAVGSVQRLDLTDHYKHKEGTEQERATFERAKSSLVKIRKQEKEKEEKVEKEDEKANADGGTSNEATPCEASPNEVHVPKKVLMSIKEESQPVNGQDISLWLKMKTEDQTARPFSINISIQAMRYTGAPAVDISTEHREETLQPGQELSIPIVIPFSVYGKHLLICDSLNVSAVATDKQDSEHVYLAETDIVPQDPPISLTVLGPAQLNREVAVEVSFVNPVDEPLKDGKLTISGSGLIKKDIELSIPDIKPDQQMKVKVYIYPYKVGVKTMVVDFDCSVFRDIKGSCTVDVKPA